MWFGCYNTCIFNFLDFLQVELNNKTSKQYNTCPKLVELNTKIKRIFKVNLNKSQSLGTP